MVLGVYAGNAMVAFAAVGMNSLYFRQGSIAAEEKYMAQRDRADSLLLNVLPPSVADRLKHEPDHAIADRCENVTVLFADLVGFTPASVVMEPEATVVLLNDLFSNFDRICDECGAEKVKTIGDGYMAICDAPIRRQDHAHVMAEVALKIRDHVADRVDPLPIQIRIGLNSGEVVGAIVGSSRFHYDVFSDTVNVAARMESTGRPGRVHLTRATTLLLAGDYDFEERGTIPTPSSGQIIHRPTGESASVINKVRISGIPAPLPGEGTPHRQATTAGLRVGRPAANLLPESRPRCPASQALRSRRRRDR